MSVNSKMTALADEIRELSGASEALGLDAMANHISETNTEVATQADLIAQIQVAVNSLPEVSSGNVETCIVTLNGRCPLDTGKVFYTNGSSSIQEISFPDFNKSISITVIKNSIIVTYQIATYESGNAIALNAGTDGEAYFIFGDTTITSG